MATIYVVLGTTGEWADREQWNVCFKPTQAEAEEVRALCQAQADDYYRWYYDRRPKKSFLRRHDQIRNLEFRDEMEARREAMFDKWFSCDYTKTKYYVFSLSEDPSVDPRWIEHKAWWKNWEAERLAEQGFTLDDRSPIAKLGDLLRRKLTLR